MRLIDPSWQLNGSNSLQNLAFLPLIGTCLLQGAVANAAGSRHSPGWIPRPCAAVCIGFLLLIPLQATAMWRPGILIELPANRAIATIAAARSQIASSRDLSELGNALINLPGAPKLPPGFNQPVAQLRQSMDLKLASDLEKLRSSQKQRTAARRLPEILVFSRAVLLDLVFAVFFGAVAGFRLSRLLTLSRLAKPLTQRSNCIKERDHRRAYKRRTFASRGQTATVGSVLKAFNRQFKHVMRRGDLPATEQKNQIITPAQSGKRGRLEPLSDSVGSSSSRSPVIP